MEDVGTNPEDTVNPWEASFRSAMKRQREEKGLSQADLSDLLRERGLAFHQQTIARVESGHRSIRLNEAMVIAEALGAEFSTMVIPGDEARLAQLFRSASKCQGDVRNYTRDLVYLQKEIRVLAASAINLRPATRKLAEEWANVDAAEIAVRFGTEEAKGERDVRLRASRSSAPFTDDPETLRDIGHDFD